MVGVLCLCALDQGVSGHMWDHVCHGCHHCSSIVATLFGCMVKLKMMKGLSFISPLG